MSADLTFLVCLEIPLVILHCWQITMIQPFSEFTQGVVFLGTPWYILPEIKKIDAVILTPNSRFLKGIKNHLRPHVAILTIRHSWTMALTKQAD